MQSQCKLSIIVGVGVLGQRGLMGDIGMDILVAAGTFVGRSQELGADPGFFLGGCTTKKLIQRRLMLLLFLLSFLVVAESCLS